MKIEDCFERFINVAELARQIGYSRPYVTAVVLKQKKPSKRFLEAVEKVPIEAVTKKYVNKLTKAA